MVYTVFVGYSTHRPIRPDERWSVVKVEARGGVEATLVAAQIVASRVRVGMVTSTTLR